MCGIAGIIKYGKEEIREEQISLLLTGNEHRGNDATGIALQDEDGAVTILKHDVPSWKFVTMKPYNEFIEKYLTIKTRVALLHTRLATQGNPRKNANNHPMFDGNFAVIHNGSIYNDDVLFDNLKLKRTADTDSDIIRAILDEFGMTEKGVHILSRINGSVAGAAVSLKYPGKVLLMKSGSPMTLASTENFLYFSSEKETLHRAMRPFVKRWGIDFQQQHVNVGFAPMPEHTAWMLGPKGIEFHSEFKTLFSEYLVPCRKTYEEYEKRQDKWSMAKNFANIAKAGGDKSIVHKGFKEAWCQACCREWLIPKNGEPWNFTCNKEKKGCGKPLVAKSAGGAN